ncbi:MAG: hypothetical protein QW304_08760 [Thermoproteota archaeon]
MKITLKKEQLKQTSEIPELVSLLRAYKALDNLILKYKQNAGILYPVARVKKLLEDVQAVTDELRKLKAEILHFKTDNFISTVYVNPELNLVFIDEYLNAYKNAKRVLDYSELKDIQLKLIRHIKRVTDMLVEYRDGKYYIPKNTRQLIQQIPEP